MALELVRNASSLGNTLLRCVPAEVGCLKRWGKPGWVEGTGGIQNYRAPVNKQPLRGVPFDSPHDAGRTGYLFMKRRREGQVSGVDTYSDPGLLRFSLPRVEGLKPVGFRCPGVSWGQIAKTARQAKFGYTEP